MPVLVVGLLMGPRLPVWSYVVAFGAVVLGALAYFARARPVFAGILPEGYKYEQLLVICVLVLVVGCAAVLAGARWA